MNGFLLLIPFFIIRFVLLRRLSSSALQRAAHFAPMQGKEKIAYYVYQISNVGIVLYPLFLTIQINTLWYLTAGLLCYLLGLSLCAVTMVSFSAPDHTGLNMNGVYRFSRNPMYVAYFICFIGIALLTQSRVLFAMVVVFQVSAHWIILAEERWCLEKFGADYERYMHRVRRYI